MRDPGRTPRGAQLGAWASPQSGASLRPRGARRPARRVVACFGDGAIVRPAYWGGYRHGARPHRVLAGPRRPPARPPALHPPPIRVGARAAGALTGGTREEEALESARAVDGPAGRRLEGAADGRALRAVLPPRAGREAAGLLAVRVSLVFTAFAMLSVWFTRYWLQQRVLASNLARGNRTLAMAGTSWAWRCSPPWRRPCS